MSQGNVERLRVAHEAFLAGKSEFGVELLDPEVEWDASESPVFDNTGVYRGIEGVRQFWREWLAAWETVQFDYELVEAGDRVVALIDQRMRGRSTGIEVPMGKYAQVYTFREGLIVHWKLYPSQSDALEAVGLRRQPMSHGNVEVVRRAHEAFNSAGLDALLEHFDPDAEYDVTAGIGPYAGIYNGRAAIRGFLADYFESWEYVRLEPEDFVEVGTDHVVFLLRMDMRGKGSGVEVEALPTNVWTVRGGKVVRVAVYNDRREALRATRHSEQDGHADA